MTAEGSPLGECILIDGILREFLTLISLKSLWALNPHCLCLPAEISGLNSNYPEKEGSSPCSCRAPLVLNAFEMNAKKKVEKESGTLWQVNSPQHRPPLCPALQAELCSKLNPPINLETSLNGGFGFGVLCHCSSTPHVCAWSIVTAVLGPVRDVPSLGEAGAPGLVLRAEIPEIPAWPWPQGHSWSKEQRTAEFGMKSHWIPQWGKEEPQPESIRPEGEIG